jgi:hypothetical protein
MSTQALAVPFHGANLFIVELNDQPYAPMKPIVEGMGLDWASQFTKIKQRFKTCVAEITMQLPGDDQRRAVICLPLRKLAGWLMTINAGKVREEIRPKVIEYQNECDDALWDYWTKGQATRPSLPHPKKTSKALPGCLTIEQQDAVKALVKSRAEHIEDPKKQAAATIGMWSAIGTKFGVRGMKDGYKNIPAEHFGEVLSLVARLPLEGEHIPAEKPESKPMVPDYAHTRERLAYLRGFAGQALPPKARDAFTTAINELDRCLVSGWTEVDEALLHFHLGISFLNRWKGSH